MKQAAQQRLVAAASIATASGLARSFATADGLARSFATANGLANWFADRLAASVACIVTVEQLVQQAAQSRLAAVGFHVAALRFTATRRCGNFIPASRLTAAYGLDIAAVAATKQTTEQAACIGAGATSCKNRSHEHRKDHTRHRRSPLKRVRLIPRAFRRVPTGSQSQWDMQPEPGIPLQLDRASRHSAGATRAHHSVHVERNRRRRRIRIANPQGFSCRHAFPHPNCSRLAAVRDASVVPAASVARKGPEKRRLSAARPQNSHDSA